MFEPSTELATMIAAARSAGACLLRYFRGATQLEVQLKGPADFVSTADLDSEKTLKAILLGAYPGRGIVTEESAPTVGVEAARYIVDPLDGTSNFVHGIPHFAVSIALEREGRVVAGVVLDPALDELFAAERGCGAWLNGARLRVSGDADFSRALVGTGIPHANAPERHARYMPMLAATMRRAAGIRRLGAAALDLAYVAAGRFAAHFEFGLSPWDIAAGCVLVDEAGGRVTDPWGGESFLATGSVLATNGSLHPQMLAILGRSRNATKTKNATKRPSASRRRSRTRSRK